METSPIISGVASRPIPAILPLDYYASLCAAWLDALGNAAMFLPASANRELALLDANQQNAKTALCALLFPVEVVTPEFSAGAEIKVFLKYPDNMGKNLNAIFARPAKIFLVMALIGEMRHLLEETQKVWPKSLEPGKTDFSLLEKLSAQIGALWAMLNDHSEKALQKSFDVFPQSPSLAMLLGIKYFQAGHWEDVLDMTARARENIDAHKGEIDNSILKVLNAIILNMRGQAHFQKGQLALAEFDIREALKLFEGSNPAWDLHKELLLAHAALKREKRNFNGMCADLEKVCRLGDCHKLLEARLRGFCDGGKDVPAGSD